MDNPQVARHKVVLTGATRMLDDNALSFEDRVDIWSAIITMLDRMYPLVDTSHALDAVSRRYR